MNDNDLPDDPFADDPDPLLAGKYQAGLPLRDHILRYSRQVKDSLIDVGLKGPNGAEIADLLSSYVQDLDGIVRFVDQEEAGRQNYERMRFWKVPQGIRLQYIDADGKTVGNAIFPPDIMHGICTTILGILDGSAASPGRIVDTPKPKPGPRALPPAPPKLPEAPE
jgi:hypothetical protein